MTKPILLTLGAVIDAAREEIKRGTLQLQNVRPQTELSSDIFYCSYRSLNDKAQVCRCVVGAAIPDDAYNPNFDNSQAMDGDTSFYNLVHRGIFDVVDGGGFNHIEQLQNCHDFLCTAVMQGELTNEQATSQLVELMDKLEAEHANQ